MSPAPSLPILAVTGMRAEARLADGPGVRPLVSGGDAARFAPMLQAALARGAKGVISFGIAGGLAPDMPPGTVILAQAVHVDGRRMPADPAWLRRLSARLSDARLGDLVGVEHAVTSTDGKAMLHRTTGALAVDMESHIAARLAARHGVPFVALRVIADPAHRALPKAAMAGLRPDGRTDAPAVLRALLRRPGDIPALLRIARDTSAAFAALAACRRSLSGALGFDEIAGVAGALLDGGVFGGRGEVRAENG